MTTFSWLVAIAVFWLIGLPLAWLTAVEIAYTINHRRNDR